MTDRVRTLIVDDDVPTRIGIATILSTDEDLEVVGEASNGLDALTMVEALDPDVVIMDVRLPGIDGIEATRRITAAGARSRVLVLTTFALDDLVRRSLDAGASAFVLKRASAEELIHAVHAVASGEPVAMADRPASAAPAASPRIFTPPLTNREAEILILVARGLSNRAIATELSVSLETVRSHVKHIYLKCGASDRSQAVIAAYESGLVHRSEVAGLRDADLV